MEESFDDETKNKIWSKGEKIYPNDPSNWRKDQCEAYINWKQYGNRDSDYGWEIDHIDCDRNNNELSNLRPLQWKNNLDKGDGKLKCNITSSGIINIDKSK